MTSEPAATSPAFWSQPTAERTLRRAMESSRPARAYLFTGPDGVGKWAAAQWLAQALLCRAATPALRPCRECDACRRVLSGSHPDRHALFPVPSSTAQEDGEAFLATKRDDPYAVIRFKKRPYITIDRIRHLIRELNRTSVEGGAKVVIIHGAEQTQDDDAQAALLKTIEEPPAGTHFILCTSNPSRLLPTIVSRCQTVRFAAAHPDVIAERLVAERGLDSRSARELAALAGGGWGNALRLADEDSTEWRQAAATLWDGVFHVSTSQMLGQIAETFPAWPRVGFDRALQAFDVWGWCLRRDCARAGGVDSDSGGKPDGAPVADPETAWSCWRILQNGRATLYVNVSERHAVAGTFLTLRRRLHLP